MATNRIVNRIGDIYCIEIDNEYKCYFQYIAKDSEQLNSQVIRVFKTRHPMDIVPEMDEIIKDDVWFYTHTFLRSGLNDNVWYKVGKSKELGLTYLFEVQFVDVTFYYKSSRNSITKGPYVQSCIWRVNTPRKCLDTLPKQLVGIIEEGGVNPYEEILERLKFGFSTWINDSFLVVKRFPLPHVDIFLKFEGFFKSTYYHFRGQEMQRKIIDCGFKVKLSKPHLLDNLTFTDVALKLPEFITRKEFEEEWQ